MTSAILVNKCRLCGNSNYNKTYTAREMMFGFRDEFEYFQCSKCDCLQIKHFPSNMDKYYPYNYYSFTNILERPFSLKILVKYIFRKLRNNFAIFQKGLINKLLYRRFPIGNTWYLHKLSYLHGLPITKKSKILDIGCGSGRLLYSLSESSLKTLCGVDPYIEGNIYYNNNLRIIKNNIHDIDGKWDLIMLHHSFEHILDPLETLQSISNLLSDTGICLLRIPIVSSFAWEHYREKWVQLDAPRHFFIHSIKSINLLAQITNLLILKTVYDSTAFQFWGSEQYMRDIPLTSDRSYSVNPSKSLFSQLDIDCFGRKASILNGRELGDQVAFYLKKR